MSKNRGTLEGDLGEKEFVKYFNNNKSSHEFENYMDNFSYYDINELFMVRVTTQQFSKLSNQTVKTRSDSYLIHSVDNKLAEILSNYNNYLDEDILENNEISYSKINFSGVSIKLADSSKFQILKLTPNSFKSLFGNSELGAGACLFCKKDIELPKNCNLINGWLSTEEKMKIYFNEIINNTTDFYLNKEICKKIKNYSEHKLKQIIDNSKELQEKIFNGSHLYEEPYAAYYFSHNGELTNLNYIPFNITTGSGRSRGKYTLVLKPK